MLIFCPQCNKRLSVEKKLIPAAGAWAVCPACKERFFIHKSSDLLMESLIKSDPLTDYVQPCRKRSIEAEKLLSRIKKSKGAYDDQSVNSCDALFYVTVFPETAPKFAYYNFILIIFVLSIFAFMIYLVHSPALSMQEPQETPESIQYSYADMGVTSDFKAIREGMKKYNKFSKYIDYSGRESRIFNYVLSQIGNGLCTDLENIRIWSYNTAVGFSMDANCISNKEVKPQMLVLWRENDIDIKLNNGLKMFVSLD